MPKKYIYKLIATVEMTIEAPTEEEARDEFIDRFSLDAEEVECTCIGEE